MFDTHDAGRLAYLTAPGEYIWSYVGTYFCAPWFHVTCLNTDGENAGLHQTFMLSDVKQLIEMSQRENTKIEFVDLVSPYYLNGSNRWKMEPLKEIWLSERDEEPGQYEHVFVLENGGRYLHSTTVSDDKLYINQLIFQI